jgi:pilus assembly protein FimV
MKSGGLGNLMPGNSLKMMQVLGLTAGLTLSAWGHAVGLGGINVASSLGQPLKAEIELVAVGKADKPSLVARLASPDAYKGAGLDYPYGAKYTFQIESRDNGEPYLKLSSTREINDPFVSLLVELSWASGKLMREYTFLLDPPGYVAVQPKSVVAPEVVPATVQEAPAEVKAEPQSVTKPEEVKSEPIPAATDAPAETPAAKPVEVRAHVRSNATAESVAVKRGDSLSKIAAQVKPADVSLERMLVALYRANTNQFDGKNMNRISVGKILRMPDQNSLEGVAQAEAVKEIHAQANDWNAYRQKLSVAATSSRQSASGRQVETGKITSAAADNAPVASESAKEVLRLSKGEKPGDTAGGSGRSAQEKKNAAAEDAIAKSKAIKEEKARAALLASNLKDMERLAKIKSEAAALAASAEAAKAEEAKAELAKAEAAKAELAKAEAAKAASAVSAASEVVAVSAVAAASEVVAVSHVAAASAVKPAPIVVEEPSFMDFILESPMMLGAGAVALLGLGGLGIFMRRRKQEKPAAKIKPTPVEDVEATASHIAIPVPPSPDTGDFTVQVAAPVEEANHHFDDVDPISEADLFLNFGRDEQAEEVLKDALQRTPDNHQIHLKLLGIYANRQDTEAFTALALQLQNSGDADAIAQAALLGRKLNSVNQSPAEAAEDAGSATMQMVSFNEEALPFDKPVEVAPAPVEEPKLDDVLDFDFDMPTALTAAPSSIPAAPVDFDVTSADLAIDDFAALDFDVTSSVPVAEKPQTAPVEEHNLDDLIFDVMSGLDNHVETSVEEEPEQDDSAFTLDFPTDDIKPVTVQPPSINLADIDLDLGEPQFEFAEPRLELAEPELDLAEPVATASSEAADSGEPAENSERWHEVATKLDLARAYQEMGDDVGAREILDEVMLEGDAAQKLEAQQLIEQLS